MTDTDLTPQIEELSNIVFGIIEELQINSDMLDLSSSYLNELADRTRIIQKILRARLPDRSE